VRFAAAASLLALAACGGPPELEQARRLVEQGQGWDAAAALVPLLDRDPVDPEPHRLYVEALLLDGQTLAAASAYERLARRFGEHPSLLASIARLVLQGAAASDSGSERLTAAQRAGVAGRAGTELLRGLLADPDPAVALAAATGLARHGDPAGVARLERSAADKGPWPSRARALEALVEVRPAAEARTAVQGALASGDAEFSRVAARLAVAHGLGRYPLHGHDADPELSELALAAAAAGSHDAAVKLRERLLDVLAGRTRAATRADLLLSALSRAGFADREVLGPALRHADYRLRRTAAEAAARLPPTAPERRELLLVAAKDRVAEVAVVGAAALSERASDRFRVRVLRAVGGGDVQGRLAALAGLRRLRDPRYPALVRRWLGEQEPGLRAAAAGEAAIAGLRGLSACLRPLLLAREPEVRCAGAAAVLALHGR